MDCLWKANWAETKRHFTEWWNREGLVLGTWFPPEGDRAHAEVPAPPPARSPEDAHVDPAMRAKRTHADFAQRAFPADVLPCTHTYLGAGSLALLLGSEPHFAPDTIWFSAPLKEMPEPEKLPPFRFDPENRWWKLHIETLRECRKLAADSYGVGCPDLVENIDILSALRDPQTFMLDLYDRPDWVKEKVAEINRVWFEVYDLIYEAIKLEDGSSFFSAFAIWGPGKTAKVQCDACSMLSPAAFAEFVEPALREQCEWLDYSMYHLDGTQCMPHLDILLGIEALDAIEWTPQAGIPSGGSPKWYDLYRRILAGGKSVQAIGVRPDEVIPLVDAVGPKGLYVMVEGASARQMEELEAKLESYR